MIGAVLFVGQDDRTSRDHDAALPALGRGCPGRHTGKMPPDIGFQADMAAGKHLSTMRVKHVVSVRGLPHCQYAQPPGQWRAVSAAQRYSDAAI